MWLKVAEEMEMPWRAVEAMHWQMGEEEMARRAGVAPFSDSTRQQPDLHGRTLPGFGEVFPQFSGRQNPPYNPPYPRPT